MSFFRKIVLGLPQGSSIVLTILSTLMLVAAFPDPGYGFLAWFAFVPFFFALGIEHDSRPAQFLLGWLLGTLFFFVTCWWLTFAPITYAGFPVVVAYVLLFFVAAAAGLFPALFAVAAGQILSRFLSWGVLFTPFLWTASEFLRLWVTGNNWNAVGYSQAFDPKLIKSASLGGVLLTGFTILLFNALITYIASAFILRRRGTFERNIPGLPKHELIVAGMGFLIVGLLVG